MPVDWRWCAIVLSTLFLNFSFCYFHGLDVAGFGTLLADIGLLSIAAALIVLLCFVGPCVAVHAGERSVFSLLEDSLGTGPAVAVRLCCVLFLSLWIAKVLAIPTLWALPIPDGRFSSIQRGVIAAVLLSFLFFTATRNTRTTAKLAVFTSKLGLAILVAALIRVRDGWAAVPAGFGIAGMYPPMLRFAAGLSDLALYAAPLGLFAAAYTRPITDRRRVSLAIVVGIGLPLFFALLLSSVVGMATAASTLYQPSLNPTLAMALWSHTAGSASPPRMLVAGITTFGVLRFGLRALTDCGPAISSERLRWATGAFIVGSIGILALQPYSAALMATADICGKSIAVAGAVLTADVVIRSKQLVAGKRFDAAGLIALVAGVVTATSLPREFVWAENRWWLPWFLPAYAITFLVALLGRAGQRMFVSARRGSTLEA